jgi:hypothetical protein
MAPDSAFARRFLPCPVIKPWPPRADNGQMEDSKPPIQPGVAGIVPHLGLARLQIDGAAEMQSFCRGVGRNRVAILVERAVPLGAGVRFGVDLEEGEMAGTGTVERLHNHVTVDGSDEVWAVIDVKQLEPGGARRLLRVLFRERYGDYVEHHGDRIPRPVASAATGPVPKQTPARPSLRDASKGGGNAPVDGKPKRPRVGRYGIDEEGPRTRLRGG